MSVILAPIHTAALGNSTLRFFRSPLAGPDLPWHVHDDLAACLGLPRDARRQFRQKLIGGPFKGDIRVVATAERNRHHRPALRGARPDRRLDANRPGEPRLRGPILRRRDRGVQDDDR